MSDPRIKDIKGLTFGRLTVVRYIPNDETAQGARWECLCDCGNTRIALGKHLRAGDILSCQPCADAFKKQQATKHGLKHTPEYSTWMAMRKRCNNPNSPRYNDYGGRGITVDPRWDSFEIFLQDMGKKPTPVHTIERLDVNGPYTKSNCIWATQKTQANNKRTNHLITFNGETHTMAQWAEILGISYFVIRSRLNVHHWTPEEALSTPVGKLIHSQSRRDNHLITIDGITKNLTVWCRELGLNRLAIRYRIKKLGWTPEKALFAPMKL